MNRISAKLAALIIVLAAAPAGAKTFSVSSPDGRIRITVTDGKKLCWSVSCADETVLAPSAISLEVAGKGVLGADARARGGAKRSIDRMQYAKVPVKFSQIRDHCNEMVLNFGSWSVAFRAYDNGAAYRFITSFKGNVEVLDETSCWSFGNGCEVFWAGEKNPDFITHCEADFKRLPLPELGSDSYSYLPLTFRTAAGTTLALTEADLSDYPNMMLFSAGGNSLEARFPHVIDSYELRTDRDVTITGLAPCIARTSGSRSYPWRVLLIGDDRSLLENTLPWQLSSPEDESADWSWLKPGKISWEWWASLNVYGVDFEAGVNTDTYKYYIDFAASHGLEYILLDEGWSASTLNIRQAKEGLDLQGLIDYGRSKGVGVVLWVLWTPMMEDMDAILDIYRRWGVSGVKIDFMQMQDQNMVRFYEDFAAACAKRHLLVDYHGAFKPAGLQRKYPNAMTFEGVYGMEHDKCSYDISPEHDMQLPFTRMVAGPMDYTPGACNNATRDDFAIRWSHPMSQGTRSHQAAIFIVFESPLMMLCDSPSNYLRNPEFASFLAQVPTVWKRTVAIEAVAEDYLLMARESLDGRWFAAGLTDWTARDLSLDTSFLPEGEWTVTVHRDGTNADVWAEDYKIEKFDIGSGAVLPVHMAQGGGWAAVFERK